ncbi:cytochrome P450 family protein [Rhizoctonia solani]|uniref:Cytochrome P450 family protein n=1 Tax=Rhizoctonia solani TaxID=456999 RepID=A0A8H8NSV4_9AGAM|nr:cytochrome P450 family protein [Rhizoctonia solani]QRW17612.1 cytochrome P450 family protein [Rhizoctonia solani]
MADASLLIGSTVLGSLLAYVLYRDKYLDRLSLPPSPKSYPLIGHLLSMPTEYEHLEFMKLGKILSLSVFGTTIIVLNDKEDVVNLFDKRSATYSHRTCARMVKDPTLPRKLRSEHIRNRLDWEAFGSLIGYDYFVNTVPALCYVPEWFPGANWKREVLRWRKEKETFIEELYNIGLENMHMNKEDSARIMIASFRNDALKLGLSEEAADDHVKQILITLVGAGIETTVNTLMMFFLAMVLYPEAQKKAQDELDYVLGGTRLPSFDDRTRLGCVERIVQETLRWAPVAGLALPHTCYQDDTYKGYHIPKGAIIMGNVWAITRDETVYKNPEAFDPDRFLNPATPPSPVFGWGRRRCPGIHFAQSSLFITIASILATFNIEVARDKDGKQIPPSGKMINSLILPKSYPLIGHLFSVPTKYEHLEFMKLGEQIGSKIFSLSVFGTTIIVLNDREDTANLFEKRSAIYSDRTCACMVKDPTLLNWEASASMIGYGDRWRKYRRLMNPWLTKKAITVHHRSQEQAARKLLQRLLKNTNNNWSSHEVEAEILLSVSATLFRSLYGHEVDSSSDTLATRTQKLISYMTYALLNSNYIVNTVPALRYVPKWFPGAGWKREVLKWRKEKETLIDELYEIGLEKMKTEENAHIMIAPLRNDALKLGLNKDEADDYVKQVLITMIGAGVETMVNTLMVFLLAMVLHPELQRKAQEEIDSVVGQNRLPVFDDRAQLGQIERIVQETMRWVPVAALAIPHTCFQDDTYKGYRIPKGAIIRCPGSHFAESTFFITVASILATFNIEVARDKDGKQIPPSGKMINSLILAPEEFMLKLTPRSTKHVELIQRSI